MIWEARTANIVAFYMNGGTLNGSYTVFPASQYGGLSEYSIPNAAPAGRVHPLAGFAKVWGNFAEPYNNLGWALTPEQGFTATFISSANGTQSQTCFILPDGRPVTYVRVNSGARYWLFSSTCP